MPMIIYDNTYDNTYDNICHDIKWLAISHKFNSLNVKYLCHTFWTVAMNIMLKIIVATFQNIIKVTFFEILTKIFCKKF